MKAERPLAKDDQLQLDGELVTVVSVDAMADGFSLVVRSSTAGYREAFLSHDELSTALVPAHDGGGNSAAAITALWSVWMQREIPRIRSAVLATRPLRPYAHQDEAVFGAMLPEPRLRFLLADEPGTGKTIMTGMYMVEGRRRGLIPGRCILVVPAHIVTKWIRDLERFFGIVASRITADTGRDPLDLRSDVMVWIVSVDLYTYNPDVRRKIVGGQTTWSLAVFDEAHRLTPTSQYLSAARQLTERAHHLLLLTATPHRGKEHYFRALLNLLDPVYYDWSERPSQRDEPTHPAPANYLRRMKEELRDLEGRRLFPPRSAETEPVPLSPGELSAYEAVMNYVDRWYDSESILARSIYGKRAASSIVAARETLMRRAGTLRGWQSGRVAPVTPQGFDRPDLSGADADSDEAWQEAERAVVEARSRDRRGELEALDVVLAELAAAVASSGEPSKWTRTKQILARHGIRPGPEGGQLLIFTEFTDTATWLQPLFADAGYSVRLLDGTVSQERREVLQQDFLAGAFQILVSTDAGGEGIDLQSAFVMIDWDIPWSLVRLEQRAGRLHRIGQRNAVFVYHLVAPETREGRVQEVALNNLTAAARALGGRVFDLMDATAFRAEFNYTAALAESQRSVHASEAAARSVPTTALLIQRAQEIVAEEDRLSTPVDASGAIERFAEDRVQSINPVIVMAFLAQVAQTFGWDLGEREPFPGIRQVRAPDRLPEVLGGKRDRLVAADGKDLVKAKEDQYGRASEVMVLGPTEPAFRELVTNALLATQADLVRGSAVVDTGSTSPYTLFVFEAGIERHDGLKRSRETVPFLIRYSAATAFEVQWPTVMKLATSETTPVPPPPAARVEAATAARGAVDRHAAEIRASQGRIAARSREQLVEAERRFRRSIRTLDDERRRQALDRYNSAVERRQIELRDIERVTVTPPRLIGWVSVGAGATPASLGYDPDSEQVAIAKVVDELGRLGWEVDDRQTAGVGYDLLARRSGSSEQRLIEVKGLNDDLRAVTLEQHEWAQAQQRGDEYWLYVVVHCARGGEIALRLRDPASALGGPRAIQRYTIAVSQLRPFIELP